MSRITTPSPARIRPRARRLTDRVTSATTAAVIALASLSAIVPVKWPEALGE